MREQLDLNDTSVHDTEEQNTDFFSLQYFSLATEDEIIKLVSDSPDKSCSLEITYQ
jgi:hypothetical protein